MGSTEHCLSTVKCRNSTVNSSFFSKSPLLDFIIRFDQTNKCKTCLCVHCISSVLICIKERNFCVRLRCSTLQARHHMTRTVDGPQENEQWTQISFFAHQLANLHKICVIHPMARLERTVVRMDIVQMVSRLPFDCCQLDGA